MNRSTVKGYLGELLVKERLEREGRNVLHLGNQSSVDLQFDYKGRTVSVDVKLSLLKQEFGPGISHWGWALQHENKKRAISATHFICVGCSETLEIDTLFIVRAGDVNAFPPGDGQFGKVKHGFVLPSGRISPRAPVRAQEAFKKGLALLRTGQIVRLRKNQSISAACG